MDKNILGKIGHGLIFTVLPFLACGCSNGRIDEYYRQRLTELRNQRMSEVDIAYYLEDNFEYVSDMQYPLHKWQSPVGTMRRGAGDCEDFAKLASFLAEELGYVPQIILLNEGFFGDKHMLSLLHDRRNNLFGALGRYEYFPVEYSSIEDLIKNGINPNAISKYNYYMVLNLDDMYGEEWRNKNRDLTRCVNPFAFKKVK
jgi:hypothetical protein